MIENKYWVVYRNEEPIPCLLDQFKIILLKLQIVKKRLNKLSQVAALHTTMDSFYKEFKSSLTFSFKIRKQRKKCYHVSTYHHSQKLLDQVRILYVFELLQYCMKISYVSFVLWSGFRDFTSRELSVQHLVSFRTYSMKHNQV